MSESSVPRMQKWPFFLGDVVALIACFAVYNMGGETFETGKAAACIVCLVFGAVLAVYPFIQEYRLDARFAEADQLAQVSEFMTQLEKVRNSVTVATAHLETAQDYSEKTIQSCREIAERMTEEAKAFADFMAKANDAEKSHLQLEVDKLRQGEAEWVKTSTVLLDETFRIHRAAAQAGNLRVADQLAKFQSVCRAAAGRVGLVPFEAEFGEPFNSETHALPEPGMEAPEDARVGATLAPGYTYLRRPLRPAIVQLQGAPQTGESPAPAAQSEDQPQAPEVADAATSSAQTVGDPDEESPSETPTEPADDTRDPEAETELNAATEESANPNVATADAESPTDSDDGEVEDQDAKTENNQQSLL